MKVDDLGVHGPRRERMFSVGSDTYKATWFPFCWEVRVFGWRGHESDWTLVGTASRLREARRLIEDHATTRAAA